ncbi:TonB-dependent receptor [Bacteroides ilei]|uniref:TonB-dependent receptor n=1 Tax=Bacteroides ilei TaxID=1907658 RepID=UPI0009305968|nr:TonB-dependent receptor [Bacteroides ilei]
MKKHLKQFLAFAVMALCCTVTAVAQATLKGKIVDAETNDALIGATVSVKGSTLGAVTDMDGLFSLKVNSSNPTLEIKYLGYKDITMRVTQKGNVDLGIIGMQPDAHVLSDVVITSSIAVARKTPVAVSTVAPEFIEEKLGTQEFPEILKATPGVYATKQGGGYGDSKINMRGFKSENIAVMVNGIPMNDMEWGGLYWSNWAGLSDVTRSMQTQRGLGASKVSAPSVGGSINIITRSIDQKKGGSVSYAMGNDGYNKVTFHVSTGLSKTGWALTLLGGKTWGDGYIQGTDFEGYNYFVNISKRINDDHQLSFTAFAAPQWHNQRNNNDGLSIKGWQQVKNFMGDKSPYRYNPTYGFGLNGERKTSSYNSYHKPQISLNHQWQINEKSSLSTVAYVSIGRGYGYSGQGYGKDENGTTYRNMWYGSYKGTLNTYFRNADGTFAYDQIYDLNGGSENGSLMAMSKSINEHNWYGLLSTYTTKFGKYIDFYGGIDYRYYKGTHTNELVDLYGGEFFLDESRAKVNASVNAAAANPGYATQKLGVGDVVYRDYDGYAMSEGVFAQAEFNKDNISAFLAGSLSNTGYWRYDRFYYDEAHAKSETVNFLGYTIKGGANYNINKYHNVFANIGYISRAPFFSGGAFLQSTTSNATNPDAVNEKIFSFELGYGFRSQYFTANLNLYHTQWFDKTNAASVGIENEEGIQIDRATINMTGVDATHQGIELDFVAKPFRWLDITGMFSIGNWRWSSTPKGYFYNSLGQPLAYKNGEFVEASGIMAEDHAWSELDLDGVKVGGSAQTTAALGANVKLSKDLKVGMDCTFFGRNYADWSINSSDLTYNVNKTLVYETPWRMPSAYVFDLNASYRFNIGKLNAILSGNINNLFNQEYITDATDGSNHDWESAYGIFYGFGRTYNIRLKVNF